MDIQAEMRRLKRHVWLTYFVSSFVGGFGVICLCLFFNPALVGVPPDQFDNYRGVWVWLVVGLLFVTLSIAGVIYLGRWIHRAVWVFQNVSPEQMQVTIKTVSDSDQTNYYAYLREEQHEHPTWKVNLYHPSFREQHYPEQEVPAQVYFDPKTENPIVIKSEYGVHWAFSSSGATRITQAASKTND